jgi:2-keto-4-pentenoate hydratase/2-oxohepta-3-ene-1,7-dioic acid hydratase in catechol pathway
MAKKRGEEPNIPPNADIGYRANNALIAHNENIVIPHDAGELVQYEAELVAVIGTKAKYLSESEALSCVLGWTIGNDMSERTWQRGDRTLWRAKNTDTFKPMGPWINILDETFHMHLRTDHIRELWAVRKPTSDGHVTSLEAYEALALELARNPAQFGSLRAKLRANRDSYPLL